MSKKKLALVQEVAAESISRVDQLESSEPAADVVPPPMTSTAAALPKKTEKVVKKGFLNDLSAKGKTSNIYPEHGSDEGVGGAKGGTYQRFMSKCQVVDTSKVTSIDLHSVWNVSSSRIYVD